MPIHSDTIAREQQIRELNHHAKQVSSMPKVQTQQHEPRYFEIAFITVVYVFFAFFTIGRFLINNGPLIWEAYYALTDPSNDPFAGTSPLLETFR